MEKKRTFIGLKDVITVTLFAAICIILNTVILLPFAVNVMLVLVFVPFLDQLICGPVYMLAAAKAPRIGMHFLYCLLFGVYYLVVNGMPMLLVILAAGGLIGELILLGGGYRSTVRLIVAYALNGLCILLAPVMLLLAGRAQMEAVMLENGASAEYIEEVFGIYSAQNIILGAVLATAGAVLGILLGRKFLKKHFQPAGVANE